MVGEYDSALVHLDYVLKREPRNTSALYSRGMTYFALDKPKAAEKDLLKVLKFQPDHAAAAIALGRYYAEEDEYKKVLKTVRPVAFRQPSVAELHYLTGLGYEKTGKSRLAKRRYERALELDPNLVEARRALDRLQSDR